MHSEPSLYEVLTAAAVGLLGCWLAYARVRETRPELSWRLVGSVVLWDAPVGVASGLLAYGLVDYAMSDWPAMAQLSGALALAAMAPALLGPLADMLLARVRGR